MNAPKLSIVLATYNERENIRILLNKIEHIILKARISTEIIVVDDGSPDKTSEVSIELNKKYKNIRTIIRTEKGLASALVRGFNESKGEYILTMDSDLAHDPSLIPSMIKLLDEKTADFVIGSRYLKESVVIGKPPLKAFASKTAQQIAQLVLRLPVVDSTNNFRMFRRSLFAQIASQLHPEGNAMLMELVYLAHEKNNIILELPTHYTERRYGETKLNLFKETVNFLKSVIQLRFQ